MNFIRLLNIKAIASYARVHLIKWKEKLIMEKEKSGKRILLTLSWIAAFLPYLFSPIIFGPFAFFLGIVLRRDYDIRSS